MGKVLSTALRPVRNFAADRKAEKVITKLEKGETKILAPMGKTDEYRMREAELDDRLNFVGQIDSTLISRINEVDINVTGVKTSERREGKFYPSRDSERLAAGVSDPEYGFFEPSVDKLAPGKLTFRESLQLMSANLAIKFNPEDAIAQQTLITHPANARIDEEKRARMHNYFSPFETVGEMKLLDSQTLDLIGNWKRKKDVEAMNIAEGKPANLIVARNEQMEGLSLMQRMMYYLSITNTDRLQSEHDKREDLKAEYIKRNEEQRLVEGEKERLLAMQEKEKLRTLAEGETKLNKQKEVDDQFAEFKRDRERIAREYEMENSKFESRRDGKEEEEDDDDRRQRRKFPLS